MDSIESIAAFSTAQSMAELQNAVAVKVLKLAQGQGQVAADLISETTDNLEQTITSLAENLGGQLDSYA
jgi:hypothetical protein